MAAAPPASAYSPAELWYWESICLSQPWWNISTFGGARLNLPTYRGSDYEVPYRAGQAWRAKYPDSRTITLNMWTDGIGSSAGYPSADQRLAFNDNIQQLRQAFFSRNAGGSVQGQLKRNWYLTQNGAAQLVTSTAMAEIAGSMDLTMNGRTNAAFSVDFLLADPYFYGASRSQAVTGTSAITAFGEGVAGEGWASPVNSFTVQVSAPATVTNETAGVSFTLGTGPAYPVTVDILNQAVTDSSGANWVANLTHAGSRMWMCLLSGSNEIAVSAGTATFDWNDAYV